MLSHKLKNPQNRPSIMKWAGIAAPLYVFGFWVRQGLMWVYTFLPLGAQASSIDTIMSVNSLLTLLVAAIVSTVAWLTFRQKKKINTYLVGTSIILVGVYFFIYDLVSVWAPIYRDFLPLVDFWMITLPILGIAVLWDSKYSTN
jgi:hypothetical protein